MYIPDFPKLTSRRLVNEIFLVMLLFGHKYKEGSMTKKVILTYDIR